MTSVGTLMRETLLTPPKRYQIQGVRFMDEHDGRIILGDDMGLGKTYQVAAYIAINLHVTPVIVACPSGLKYAWHRQLLEHAGLKSVVLEGRTPRPVRGHIFIINYDILSYWLPVLLALGPHTLVVDECHKLMNLKAQRTKTCQKLAVRCKHVLALSGTPILSRPVEFFPVLNMVAPNVFPAFWPYAWRYCRPHRGFQGRGWVFNGATNLEELHAKVAPLMIRRMKKDVLTELPQTTRSVIPVTITNRTDYERAEADIVKWVRATRGEKASMRAAKAQGIIKLQALKLLTALGKLAALTEWVKDWMNDTDRKIILFGIHRPPLDLLLRTFPNACQIRGQMTAVQKQQNIDRFQNDKKSRLMLANLDAGGVGHTLTAADAVGFFELGWHPTAHDQASDRVNRIGQTSPHVDAFYFIGHDTVEEKIIELLDSKRKVCGKVIDGETEDDILAQTLQSLFEKGVK